MWTSVVNSIKGYPVHFLKKCEPVNFPKWTSVVHFVKKVKRVTSANENSTGVVHFLKSERVNTFLENVNQRGSLS